MKRSVGDRARVVGVDLVEHPTGELALQADDTWERVHAANLTSVFVCCKHGIPYLLENRPPGGSMINTSSFLAQMGAVTAQMAYSSAQAGVLALSRDLGFTSPSAAFAAAVAYLTSDDAGFVTASAFPWTAASAAPTPSLPTPAPIETRPRAPRERLDFAGRGVYRRRAPPQTLRARCCGPRTRSDHRGWHGGSRVHC